MAMPWSPKCRGRLTHGDLPTHIWELRSPWRTLELGAQPRECTGRPGPEATEAGPRWGTGGWWHVPAGEGSGGTGPAAPGDEATVTRTVGPRSVATRAEAHYSAGGPGRRAQGRLGRVLPGSGLGPAPVSWESSGLHAGVWAERRVMGGVAGAVLAGGPVGPGGRRPSWAGDVLAPLWGCPGSWRPGEGLWVSQVCTRPRTPGGQRACAWRRDAARGRVTFGRGADQGRGRADRSPGSPA